MRRDEWGRPLTETPAPHCKERVCGDFTLPVWDEWYTPSRSRKDHTRKPDKGQK